MRRLAIPLVVLTAACAVPPSPAVPPAPVPASAPAPTPADERAALRRSIDSAVNAPQFANAFWGILIVDPASGDTLYAHDAGKLFMPASNQKIITGAAALAQLGPDYTYRTTFATRGSVRDSTLRGDLLVFGRGDPTISDHMRKDAMEPLRGLADSLRAHGIRKIAGRLVAGGDAFVGPVLGYGWDWDDLDYGYGAGVDELLFNEGFTLVTAYGGAKPGAPIRVTTKPTTRGPKVRVTALTVAAPTDSGAKKPELIFRYDSTTGGVLVEGSIVVGDSADEEVAHRVPKQAYLDALAEALGDRGITVAAAKTDTTARVDTLFQLISPPLREILPALEKPSQNQIAEVLFRTLALEKTGVGSTDSARKVIERQLAAWGAKPEGAAVRDGSGLSRHDYVSPETLVRVLAAIRSDSAFQVFYDALPIAGVDGTLAKRMRGTPAEGNVHAKTGSVDKARSLSGYATTADGHVVIFSALCNNWTVPVRQVEAVQDMIGARLAAMTLGTPATH
ncbi:MAG: D-alanyl-D-alanine carboxypeptidase/D-alanyl-D-alanine-endopeptidase [Gemmatimonadaceae bacterium]|nr:D-alanyl-D-alanine carboxypeptidase/D-alanyl-D-alanine-endopeptidase [Gemmatimonadaceae bacterium]